MTEHEIENQIKQLIDSGKYFQLGFELIESIKNIELNEDVQKIIDDTTDYYKDYLEDISKLTPDFQKKFLHAIKEADVIDNQSMEKEDSFLISIYSQFQKDNYAIDLIGDIDKFSNNDLITIHSALMKYTNSNQKEMIGFRNNDRKYVGKIDEYTGEKIIHYFPIKSEDVEKAAEVICNYINSDIDESNGFIKPIIVHGLIAAYQLFNDGNTRMARLMQHELIRRNTNEKFGTDFKLPTFYATRLYYPLRANYRALITKLVLEHNNEAWNEWIKFNGKTFDNSIAINYDNIVKLERSISTNLEDNEDITTRYYKK